jgi:putative flippase GtrA
MPTPDSTLGNVARPRRIGVISMQRIWSFVLAVKRYGIVSLICYLTNNLLLIGLDRLGAPLWLSLILSAAAVISLAFLLHARITYSSPVSWPSFGRYVLVQLPNVPIVYLLLWSLNDGLALPMVYSAPIVTTTLVGWNALGSFWALRKR